MKHLFIFCLIFSLTTSGYGFTPVPIDEVVFEQEDWGWGEASVDVSDEENDNCGSPEFDVPFGDIYKVKCRLTRKNKEALCRCLDKSAEENIAIRSLNDNSKRAQEYQEKLKARKNKYMRRFEYVYSKMTIEAALQEKVLGLERPSASASGEVGCTARNNSDKVKEFAKNYYNNKKDELQKVLTKRQEEYDVSCTDKKKLKRIIKSVMNPVSCERLKNRINNLKIQISAIEPKSNSFVKDACAVMDYGSEIDRIKQQINYWKEQNNPDEVKRGEELLDQIAEIMRNSTCAAAASPKNPAFQNMSLNYTPLELPGKPSAENLKKQMDQYFKRSMEESAAGHGGEAQCEDGDKLCQKFDITNKALKGKMAQKFKNDPSKDCLNFAEFQMFHSRPSKELMDKLATKRGFNDIFNTPTSDEKAFDKSHLNFLRSNPILVKLASDENNKQVLTAELQKLAKGFDKLDKKQQLKAYFDFMKGSKENPGIVKKLMDKGEGESTEMFVCTKMQKNFTAIAVAENLPPPSVKEKKDNQIAQLNDAIQECNDRYDRKDEVDSIEKTLDTDPLFTLAPIDPDKEEKDQQAAYEALKGEVCVGYPEHIKQNCGGQASEQCREKFLNGSSFSYAKQAMDEADIDTQVTPETIDKAADRYSEHHQNNAYKDHWQANYGSQMSKNPMMFNGQEKQFLADRQNDTKIASNAEMPSSLLDTGTKLAASSNAGGTSGGSSGGGGSRDQSRSDEKLVDKQFVPDFNQPQQPIFDKNKLRAGAPIEKAIPGLADKSPTEQVELLENFKQNLSKDDQDLVPKLEEAQGLAQAKIPVSEKVSEKDTEKEKQKEKEEKKISNSNSGSGKVGQQRTQVSGANGVSTPGSVTSPRVDLSRVAKKDKTLEQLNKTLVDLNEKGDKVQGNSGSLSRGPASVNEIQVSLNTPAIVVEAFAKNEDLPKTDKGVLIVRDEDLVIKDNYNEIVNDRQKLSAFVRSSLAGEQIGSEVIRITDSKSGLQTLLLVNPGKHGLTIKRVDRIATYSGLIYANSAAAPQTP